MLKRRLEPFFEGSLAEIRQLNLCPEYLAGFLQHYAYYLLYNSGVQRAQELVQESLRLFRRLGLERWEAGCLDSLGVAAFKLGDLDKAETLSCGALAIAGKLNQRFMQARILSNLAKVATAKGDYAHAERQLRRSLQVGLDIKNPFNLAATLVSFAELRIAEGQPYEAAGWLALVAQHPKAEKPDRDEARWVLAGLRDRLPPEALEVVIKRVEDRTLEKLADDLSAALGANRVLDKDQHPHSE